MVADLGTKPLTAQRINYLKRQLRMEEVPHQQGLASEEDEEAMKKDEKVTEDEEKAKENDGEEQKGCEKKVEKGAIYYKTDVELH